MKAVKQRHSASRGVFVVRAGSSGRFKEVVVPGKGRLSVVNEETIDSAKRAAGSRLLRAMENTRRWAEPE